VVTSNGFQLVNAVGESIDMTLGNAILKYDDLNQTVSVNSSFEFAAANSAALGDNDGLLETGEVFQVTVLELTTQLAILLHPDLGTNTDFITEMIPPDGAVLLVERRTPSGERHSHCKRVISQQREGDGEGEGQREVVGCTCGV